LSRFASSEGCFSDGPDEISGPDAVTFCHSGISNADGQQRRVTLVYSCLERARGLPASHAFPKVEHHPIANLDVQRGQALALRCAWAKVVESPAGKRHADTLPFLKAGNCEPSASEAPILRSCEGPIEIGVRLKPKVLPWPWSSTPRPEDETTQIAGESALI
jgi:hypothetical protein